MAFSVVTGADCADSYETLFQMYELMRQAMNLNAAGDGNLLYDDTGTNLFTNGQVTHGIAGNICNRDAWALFDAKDASFQILWKRAGSSGYAMGTYISPTSSYDLTGAGPTTAPTASDEEVLNGEAASTLVSSGPSYSNRPNTVHLIHGDVDEEYSFFLFNRMMGYGFSSTGDANFSGLMVDRPLSVTDDEMDLRAVFSVFNNTNLVVGNDWYDSDNYQRDDNVYGEFPLAWTEGLANRLRNVGIGRPIQGNGSGIGSNDGDSDWTGRPWGFDSAFWWHVSPWGRYGGKGRMLGKSRLFRLNSGGCLNDRHHGCLGFSADLTRLYLGSLSLPWDGSTGQVLI